MSKILKELINDSKFKVDEKVVVGSTYEYEKFSFLDCNRDIKRSNVENIKKSIEDEGYCSGSYILVDEYFHILDGQHRFIACKELEMPIRVMCIDELTVDDMRRLNAYQRNWTTIDFVNHYAELEYPDFKILRGIINTSECSISEILNMLFDNRHRITSELKLGLLNISEEQLEKFNRRHKNYKMIVLAHPNNFKRKDSDDVRKLMDVLDNDFMCYTMVEKIKKCPNIIFNLVPAKTEINYYETIAKQVMSDEE